MADYINKKNGKVYTVISDNGVDCTNARDGERVVIYTTEGSSRLFVREYKEFIDKFVQHICY